jgi:hypothetical protein
VGSAGGQHEADFASFDLGPARERYVYDPVERETWYSQDYDERWRLTVKVGAGGIDEITPEIKAQLEAGELSEDAARMLFAMAPAFVSFLFRSPMSWELLKERYGIARPHWLDFQPIRQMLVDLIFSVKKIMEHRFGNRRRLDTSFFIDDEADES